MQQIQPKQKIKLRQLNIALLGPKGHGKTSLVQWLTGQKIYSPKAESKIAENQSSNDVQIYQSTFIRKHHYIYHKKYHINLFDLPEDNDFVTISNILTITNIIFVVSANPSVFNSSLINIQSILKRCELLNVKRIIFAVNFMDVFPFCNWSMNSFKNICSQIQTLCDQIKYKKEPLQISFVPTSALNGENIQKSSAIDILINHGVCKWILDNKQECLLEAIERLMISQGKTKSQREYKFSQKKKPLRLSVIGRIPMNSEIDELNDEDDELIKGVFVYIHSGKIRKNTKLLINPQQIFAIVKKIEFFTPQQIEQYKKVSNLFEDVNEEQQFTIPGHASAGQMCYLYFHNEERMRIQLGSIAGEPVTKKIPQEVNSVVSKIRLINIKCKIQEFKQYYCICGLQKFQVGCIEILSTYDSKTGRQIQNTQQQKQKQPSTTDDIKIIYLIRFSIIDSACIDRYQYIPSFGQLYLFNRDNSLCAVGRVEEIVLKHQSMDYLPRVFLIPKQQLIDAKTGDKRDDWDVCQIDLTRPQDTLCIPCGHLKMCDRCTIQVKECPFCKIRIVERRKMQAIMMEDNIDLMEFALCDQCIKHRISHAVVGCDYKQYICQECVFEYEQNQECKQCNQVHLISKIYI